MRPAAALLAALLATGTAGADDMPAEVRRGETLAGTWCSECHRAQGDEQSVMTSGAIAFQDIAAEPGRDIDELRVFMSTDHPFMPFDKLDDRDREDILAYMYWLLPRE